MMFFVVGWKRGRLGDHTNKGNLFRKFSAIQSEQERAGKGPFERQELFWEWESQNTKKDRPEHDFSIKHPLEVKGQLLIRRGAKTR